MRVSIHRYAIFHLSFLFCLGFFSLFPVSESEVASSNLENMVSPGYEVDNGFSRTLDVSYDVSASRPITFDLNGSKKTIIVDVAEIGKTEKLYVNKISIVGNKRVKDRIIRRQIELEDGDRITNKKLKNSKSNIEFLNLFERKGVSLGLHRLSGNMADIVVVVSEKSPGGLKFGLGYRDTDFRDIFCSSSARVDNLFGNEWSAGAVMVFHDGDIGNVGIRFSNNDIFRQNLFCDFRFFQVCYGYSGWSGWKDLRKFPIEKGTGASLKLGFPLDSISRRLRLYAEIGLENLHNNGFSSSIEELNSVLANRFHNGDLKTLALTLEKDTRNHPFEPSSGYRISAEVKMALPSVNDDFSFIKNILSVESYTSLIGKDKLVLDLHGFAGSVHSLKNDSGKKIIPYKELFHMGGLHTVRGFSWGELDPSAVLDSSKEYIHNPLGGRYAVHGTSEVIYSMIDQPDSSLLRYVRLKGHLFYDIGACWNTVKDDKTSIGEKLNFVVNNKFNLGHSVGCGISLLKPIDLRFSVAYRLDSKISKNKPEFYLTTKFTW